jgi:hypothetical protein
MIPIVLAAENKGFRTDIGTYALGNIHNDCLLTRYVEMLSTKYKVIYVITSNNNALYAGRLKKYKQVRVLQTNISGQFSEFLSLAPLFAYNIPLIFFDINTLFEYKLLDLLDDPYKTEIIWKKGYNPEKQNLEIKKNTLVPFRTTKQKNATYLAIKFGADELELMQQVLTGLVVKPSQEWGGLFSIIDFLNDQKRVFTKEFKGNALKLLSDKDILKAKDLYKFIKNDYKNVVEY